MASLIGKKVGNYQVVSQIGSGGMGAVYLGLHPLIGKRVAIKVLHEDLAVKEDIVSRFFTEARAVNAIGHPNIVDIVDFGEMPGDDGKKIVYFVMEFLDGEGLNARLKREGVSISEAMHVVGQCCSALTASHSKHIIHRDLKPENIFLVHHGEDRNYVKLLDFGIAKLTGDDAQQAKHQTRAGLVIGTPAYMSPEQCEGKGQIDWRSDVYSLGIVLYEMLTGRTPFTGDGFGEILVAHLTRPPPLPFELRNDVPPGIESVVMHAIEKDRTRRFQSMEEFGQALADPDMHCSVWGSPSGRALNLDPGATLPEGSPAINFPPPRVGTGERKAPTGERQRPATGATPQLTAMVAGPRPTTLSEAASEVSEAPPSKSRGPIFGLGGAGVAAAGLAVYFLVLDRPAQPPAPVPVAQPAPPKPAVPEFTLVAVDSNPRGVKAFRAGRTDPVGTTPFELKVKKGEADFDLLLKLDGYKDQMKTITTQRDHEMTISMEKVEQAPPPDEKKEKKSSSSSSSSKKKDKEKHDKDGVLEPSF